jgi:8-oxo-dGTP diphosphatase
MRLWRWLPGYARQSAMWCLCAHFIVGTVAMLVDADGRVLLARHTYRRRAPWALPGGWVKRGEDPSETIVREIREETGLVAEVLAPLTIQRETPRHLTVVYAARLVAGTFRPSAEVSEVRFVSPGAWPEGLRPDHRVLIEAFARHPMLSGPGDGAPPAHGAR